MVLLARCTDIGIEADSERVRVTAELITAPNYPAPCFTPYNEANPLLASVHRYKGIASFGGGGEKYSCLLFKVRAM